ncbi:MAG: hypothetical protein GQ536_03475 [Candidatus Aminicenantes bacterium]|nr:hypothetical protein [Candidatus Aminicenantes bacterium]
MEKKFTPAKIIYTPLTHKNKKIERKIIFSRDLGKGILCLPLFGMNLAAYNRGG